MTAFECGHVTHVVLGYIRIRRSADFGIEGIGIVRGRGMAVVAWDGIGAVLEVWIGWRRGTSRKTVSRGSMTG